MTVRRAREQRPGAYICLTNVHTTVESQANAGLRNAAQEAYLSVPDGMPLVWILRRRGLKHTEKVTGIEFIPRVAENGAEEGLRHFFYGGGEGIAAKAATGLKELVPQAQVVGELTPPFSEGADWDLEPLRQALAQTKPHILWVGLGAPKQEIWMHLAAHDLEVPIAVGVGAAFDFLAKTKRPAPRYLSRLGLEWLYRLMSEPGRLWRRYLVGNSKFVYLLVRQGLGGRST